VAGRRSLGRRNRGTAVSLTERVLSGGQSDGPFEGVVREISRRVTVASPQGAPTGSTLRDVAHGLITGDDAKELVTAGRLLARSRIRTPPLEL
jgi:hypothetical protein